ncbi:MAG: MBL fold metallo-hydrolase [Ignavibacteria bacterium]|nr:MBL fold metallo-hydrolase [Ignavibacteria bacterium]
MKLKFWGTRGSIAVTGKNYCKYGGNTPCIEVSFDDSDELIILDAGTGIRELGIDLINRNYRNIKIFLSHFHTDHIVGLPFFAPLYNDEFNIEILAQPYTLKNTEDILDLILSPPLFSITKDYFKSKFQFHNIDSNFVYETQKFKIETIKLHHPNPTLGYKVTNGDKKIVYFTDNELIQNNHSVEDIEKLILTNHKNLIDFCLDADVLIHDSSYSFDDYNRRIGWGHSSNLAVAIFANLAKVKNLYLFHYDPDYDDEFIDKFVDETKSYLKSLGSNVNCFASYDQLEILI